MEKFWCWIIFFVINASNTQAGSPHRRIVGGEIIYAKISYPFYARLLDVDEMFCSAVIVSENYALTAASCLWTRRGDFDRINIEYGLQDLKKLREGANTFVEKVIFHPEYIYKTDIIEDDVLPHDLAVIKVHNEYPFDPKKGGKPAKISTTKLKYPDFVRIAGFGKTETSEISRKLLSAPMQVLSGAVDCAPKHWIPAQVRQLSPYFICAISESGKGSCGADMGGPVTSFQLVAGIISRKRTCGKSFSQYEMYVNLASYHDFILRSTKNEATFSYAPEPKPISRRSQYPGPDDFMY